MGLAPRQVIVVATLAGIVGFVPIRAIVVGRRLGGPGALFASQPAWLDVLTILMSAMLAWWILWFIGSLAMALARRWRQDR